MKLDPTTTALIVIDLQRGIVARQAAPYSASEVVDRCAKLADAFREQNALVVLVHVAFADDRERLKPEADSPAPSGPLPADWSDIVPEIGPRDGDIVITKRQWGAFYGTALDLQLRRRGIRTLVYGGIATNFGVESTARDAYERGFEQVFVEDAMSGLTAEAHQFAITTIFPRMGRVRSTDDVLAAITAR
ncbi:MAG TPA: hydrolase [Thermoanaerobaculia bacterium]|jgi:nicotinamidase-related amidase|nr:hydrolase [Thermoanaerobaculia bacterium]